MASREVFERQGKKETPKSTPGDCDQCQYTETTVEFPGWWDTVHDASNIYNILRSNMIAVAWSELWTAFVCPPDGKECAVRESCSPKPTYLEGFATLGKAPDTNLRWKVRITVGRRLRCVKTGEGKDEAPVIPKAEPPKEESEPPKKEKSDH